MLDAESQARYYRRRSRAGEQPVPAHFSGIDRLKVIIRGEIMSVSLAANSSSDMQVITGGTLVLRVSAYDPSGISKVFVQCFQFSMASSNKLKLASGEVTVSLQESAARTSFDVSIQIPDNAALGKWGVQLIEFTNGRGYKTSFY